MTIFCPYNTFVKLIVIVDFYHKRKFPSQVSIFKCHSFTFRKTFLSSPSTCRIFSTMNFLTNTYFDNFFDDFLDKFFWRISLTNILTIYILLTSSKNQIYEFRIPNIYNYFFNNIQLMYTLCFLVASVKLKVYKKVVKFSFKQQEILGIRNS